MCVASSMREPVTKNPFWGGWTDLVCVTDLGKFGHFICGAIRGSTNITTPDPTLSIIEQTIICHRIRPISWRSTCFANRQGGQRILQGKRSQCSPSAATEPCHVERTVPSTPPTPRRPRTALQPALPPVGRWDRAVTLTWIGASPQGPLHWHSHRRPACLRGPSQYFPRQLSFGKTQLAHQVSQEGPQLEESHSPAAVDRQYLW